MLGVHAHYFENNKVAPSPVRQPTDTLRRRGDRGLWSDNLHAPERTRSIALPEKPDAVRG